MVDMLGFLKKESNVADETLPVNPALVTGPVNPDDAPVQAALDTFLDAAALSAAHTPPIHYGFLALKHIVDKLAPVVRAMLAARGLAVIRVQK